MNSVGAIFEKKTKTTRLPHRLLSFTRLYWGKGGSSSHTARGSPYLHIPNRARVNFLGRERASPRSTADPREFVLFGFARVFTGQPRGERVTRPTPGFLAVPAAVQQSILYLRDETRVVCGLWGWSVSVCSAACVQASRGCRLCLLSASFFRRPDRQIGGYPICTPGAPSAFRMIPLPSLLQVHFAPRVIR